jgi:hypothetical protein
MIKIETTAWLNEVKQLNGFSVLKCAHKTRKQNSEGAWETTSTEYIDVLVDDKRKDEFQSVFATEAPFRIEIRGSAKPQGFLKKDGEVGVTLSVYPEVITVLESGRTSVSTIAHILDPNSAPF